METIWLVNSYGPIEGENWRLYSFNQFGLYLSKQGYKVIWWTSNFSHHFKKYRSTGWKDINVNDNFIIRLVPTSAYNSNFSINRFRKDIIFARNAFRAFKDSDTPDLILSADNPLTMKYPTFKYANTLNIPVIYDQMDLWPEFIENSFHTIVKPLIHLLLLPIYWQRKKSYRQLAGVIALGKNYLEKAIAIEPTLQKKPSELIYNGIDVGKFRQQMVSHCDLMEIPVKKKENEVWFIFAGTLGPSYDIDSILYCAKRLNEEKNTNIRFIIAGSGPLEFVVKDMDSVLGNLNFVGKLLPEKLIPIYRFCDVGLSTYTNSSNVDMPDKFYDYTAAGLAIINSLRGEISFHITKNNLGINYTPGNKQELYGAILSLSNKTLLNVCKVNSDLIAMNFDMNEQNKKLSGIINKVLQNKNKNVES